MTDNKQLIERLQEATEITDMKFMAALADALEAAEDRIEFAKCGIAERDKRIEELEAKCEHWEKRANAAWDREEKAFNDHLAASMEWADMKAKNERLRAVYEAALVSKIDGGKALDGAIAAVQEGDDD